MISHTTDGIEATSIGTGIATFHIDTGFGAGTITILHTFGTAIDVRISKVVLNAAA